MKTPKVPEGIERLSPREAWLDGHRAGREELARSLAADDQARAAAESPAAVADLRTRVDGLERRLIALEGDVRDRATQAVDLGRRLASIEGADAEDPRR